HVSGLTAARGPLGAGVAVLRWKVLLPRRLDALGACEPCLSTIAERMALELGKRVPLIHPLQRLSPLLGRRCSRFFGEIGGELIHGPAPALMDAVAARIEGLALHRRRVVGLPAHSELGPAARLILEAKNRQHLQRPVLAQRMSRGTSGFVRERTDEHQLLLRDDLAI